jgi:hypothetical protein
MNIKFKTYTEKLESKLQVLTNRSPVKMGNLPAITPKGGIYLFSEGGNHLYVGRTKRIIKKRLKDHVSTADDCPFAFRLAREKTGYYKASYTQKDSRKDLLSKPEFKKAYREAKQRINKMDVRYVEEPDPIKQILLEVYVAVVLKARYNEFKTS